MSRRSIGSSRDSATARRAQCVAVANSPARSACVARAQAALSASRWKCDRRSSTHRSNSAPPPAGRAASHVPDETPSPSIERIAVLPFTVYGRGDFAYLGEGIVDLLSTSIDGAGRLRSVDARSLLGYLAREPLALGDPDRGRSVARRFGAGLYVLGSVVEVGGRIQISASLYDADGTLRSTVQTTAGEEAVFDAVDDVARRLLLTRMAGPAARLRRLAVLTTHSLPALKAFLEGESAYRLGRDAMDAYRRAVTLDPTFALAHYRLAVAATTNFQPQLAHASTARALEHGERLAERDRRLLEAFEAYLRGAPAAAERLYRATVAADPDELEAWYQLGEVGFHYGPLAGVAVGESRYAFERALALDPEHGESLVHLLIVAAIERRYDDVAALFERLDVADGLPVQIRALRAFAVGDAAEREQAAEAIGHADDTMLAVAVRYVAGASPDLAGADRLSRLLVTPQRSSEARALGHVLRGHFALAGGRRTDALRELAAIPAAEREWELEYRAIFSLAPFAPASADALRALQDELRRQTVRRSVDRPSPTPGALFTIHDDLHEALRIYLLGLVSARLGDGDEALCCASELERATGPAASRQIAQAMAASVHAARTLAACGHGSARRDAAAVAFTTLERARPELPWELGYYSPFYARALERYWCAELLLELGRSDEALRWYASLADFTPHTLPYLAPAHLRQGEICEQLGRPADAIRHYVRVAELWANADPELRPAVDRACARLASLRGGRHGE